MRSSSRRTSSSPGDVHRPLELAPHLPADLLPAVLGGAAPVRCRGVPVRDVHGEDALDRLRPVAVHRARPPDVDLGDAGERPLGVDVDRVSADHPHRAAQVELHAVHPLQTRVGELAHAGQPRIGGQEPGGEHRRRSFGGQRADVVVAHERLGTAPVRDPDAADAAARVGDLGGCGLREVGDPERREVLQPRIEPHLVRRPVEHAVARGHRGVDDVQEQLDEDVPDRAGAGRFGVRRDERARDPGGEELPVGGRARRRADELPPGDLLVLSEPPLVARREELPDPHAEVGQVVRGELGHGAEARQHRAEHRADVAGAAQEPHRHAERRAVVLAERAARGRHEVARRADALGRGYALHRVDDVPVEAGEEAEAVLAGHPRDGVLGVTAFVARFGAPRCGAHRPDRATPGLTPGHPRLLGDDDLEAALGELVGGRESRDTATEHDHPGHAASHLDGG